MTSMIKVASAAFIQKATGEWAPNNITWSSIVGVACRIFPASERAVMATWGQTLDCDAICWVIDGTVSLPAKALTGGSGVQIPVQITDAAGNEVEYLAISARSLANMGKVMAIALKRWSHG
jgi:hypothetical protein